MASWPRIDWGILFPLRGLQDLTGAAASGARDGPGAARHARHPLLGRRRAPSPRGLVRAAGPGRAAGGLWHQGRPASAAAASAAASRRRQAAAFAARVSVAFLRPTPGRREPLRTTASASSTPRRCPWPPSPTRWARPPTSTPPPRSRRHFRVVTEAFGEHAAPHLLLGEGQLATWRVLRLFAEGARGFDIVSGGELARVQAGGR